MLIFDGIIQIDFTQVEKEYTCKKDILADNPQAIIILNELPPQKRRLLILYAELQSIRKVAQLYDCSKDVIANEINEIRKYFWKRIC